jgi:hypothetical protein
MARRREPDPQAIAAALPETAEWGLAVAMPAGAFASQFKPGDAEAAESWGLIEATPARKRFNPTELGRAVQLAIEKRRSAA